MSGQATGWVLRHGPKNRAMRAVLLPIADAANRDGEHAHPGLAAIIDGSLYGRAHVLATLAKLEDEGWIVTEEEGGGRGKAKVYAIPGVLGKVQPVDPLGNGPIQGNGPIGEAKGSNPEPETVQSGVPTLSYATKDSTVESNPSSALATQQPFEEFWNAYPKRKGTRGSKSKALESWLKRTRAEHDLIAVAVGHYARFCAEADEFPADAVTWLNQRRWEDHAEPTVVPQARNGHASRSAVLTAPGVKPIAEALADMYADDPRRAVAVNGHAQGELTAGGEW